MIYREGAKDAKKKLPNSALPGFAVPARYAGFDISFFNSFASFAPSRLS